MHKVVMAVTFPKEMGGDYRKQNDKETTSFHIDHISNNEFDCRTRNLWFTDRQTNWQGKHNTDNATLYDRICVYRKEDSNGMPIYNSQKFVFIMMLGNYTKMEWESLGDSKKVIEDNRKDGKTQYNFIEYQGGRGNIICAMFDSMESAERWYKKITTKKKKEQKEIFTKEEIKALDGMDEIEKRNWKIKFFFQKYLNNEFENIPGLENMVLLANNDETIDGYIYFDNITTRQKEFLKAKKRGLVVGLKEELHGKSTWKIPFTRNIANLELSSDNIIDILYPYFREIFE